MARIERAALGRAAKIGDFYDVRTDSFLGDNIFSENLDEEDLDSMDLGDTSVELVISDKLEDKLTKLGVGGELSASILSGLVKLEGLGGFLKNKKRSTKVFTGSLIYEVKTTSEEVSIRSKDTKKKVDIEALKSVQATHVLIGIEWGACFTVTAEYRKQEKEDQKAVNGKLLGKLEYIEALLNPGISAEAGVKRTKNSNDNQFTFHSKCNGFNTDSDVPVTFDEAVEQAKSLPKDVRNTKNGKGVPLQFMFISIQSVLKMFKIELNIDTVFQSIREDTMKKCVQVFADIRETKQKICDVQVELRNNKDCVPDKSLNEVNRLMQTFESEELKLQAEFQNLLKDIRSTKLDVSVLNALIQKSIEGELSSVTVDEKLQMYQSVLNRTKFLEHLKKRGIEYIGKAKNPEIQNSFENIFVFYTDNILSEGPEFSFFWILWQTYKDKENTKLIIVDLEFGPNPNDTSKCNKIYNFDKRIQVSSDVMKDYGKIPKMCLIKIKRRLYGNYELTEMPNERSVTQIRCPMALMDDRKCKGDPHVWFCEKCQNYIWYGIQGKQFFCSDCQVVFDPADALFRCKEESHGLDFMPFPKNMLVDELSGLKSSKETNILILGETGCGKSTWINGFFNYIYFEDLAEAAAHSKEQTPVVAIPSSFTFTKDGKEKKICIGHNSDNEIQAVGQSATQKPRSYPAVVKDQIINLIDTPGIGDVRGIDQDKENFDDILAHLSNYPEIHAILVLLKPNEARLTVSFRFVIQELMTHLHRDAAKNIIFCFTNARGNFYQPGDTLPPLKELIKEQKMGIDASPLNMFCFDNEAFRFLACILNGVEFDTDITALYAQSWNKAKKETEKLLKQVSELKPHKVMNTTSLNDTRRVIVELTRPLAELTGTIQKNIQNMSNAQEQVQLLGNQAEGLEKNLQFEGIDLKHQGLERPRTVCAHPVCTETVPYGKDQIQQKTYPQICHDVCYLQGVPTDVIGDPRLKDCAAMARVLWSGCCTKIKCGHSYQYHQHRTYDIIQVKKNFISDEVKKQLDNMKNKEDRMKAKKQEYERIVSELKNEEYLILKISAKFAFFLRTFAIIPYNDALGDYIDICLEIEEQRPKEDRDPKHILCLKKSKDAYEKEQNILKDAMQKGKDETAYSPTEMKKLITELYALKHFGKTLEDIIEKVENQRQKSRVFQQENVPPPHKQKDKNKNWFMDKIGSWTNYQI